MPDATPVPDRPPPIRLRSVLFAPADQPALVPKLARAAPDAAILDLEDAVAPGAKAAARALARQGAATLAAALPVFVRVNGPATAWFADDVALGLAGELAGVVIPKLESAADVARARAALEAAGRPGLPILAGIETARGVLRAEEIAAAGVVAVYFGAEDFIADLGGERTVAGDEVAYARARVVLAARVAGVPALDQVVIDVRDGARFSAEAAAARALGYAGKLCIHPAQVPLANAAFTPSQAAVARARRILAAATAAEREQRGVINFEGQMIDAPLLAQARAVLARAGVAEAASDVAPSGDRAAERPDRTDDGRTP